MPLRPETLDRVVAMWARRPEIDVLPRVNVVVLGEHTFVRAPAHLRARLSDPPVEVDTLVEFLGDEVERVVGAARLAYADDATVHLPDPGPLADMADDDPRPKALAASADRDEWLEASADEPADARVGIVEDGNVLAIATLHEWEDTVGHVGVFTRVDARGRGLAGRAAAGVIGRTLHRDLVPQWRSRIGNDASAAVADRLGFVPV